MQQNRSFLLLRKESLWTSYWSHQNEVSPCPIAKYDAKLTLEKIGSLAKKAPRHSINRGGADRENVTVVVTICADGTTVRPLVIFKGKNLQSSWNQDNAANA
jgi:hypothetical protein